MNQTVGKTRFRVSGYVMWIMASLMAFIASLVRAVTVSSGASAASKELGDAQGPKIEEKPVEVTKEDLDEVAADDDDHSDDDSTQDDTLFPSMSEYNDIKSVDGQVESCSMQLGSKFVPIKKENGEIDWKIVEEAAEQLNDAAAAAAAAENGGSVAAVAADLFDKQLTRLQSEHNNKHYQQFSPLSELSTAGAPESQIDNFKLNLLRLSVAHQEQNLMLLPVKKTQLASPASSSGNDLSPQLSKSSVESTEEDDDESSKGKKYDCSQCGASFTVKSYLTRHIKKHNTSKLYHCPFFGVLDDKCHATGGFSRRDTYKTHMKSRHFKYPSGIKSSDRTGMVGWCGMCGLSFANNEIWVERHVEGGECPQLPATYKKRDFSKKKTGKRPLMLDAVLVNTPPPLDLGRDSPSFGPSTGDSTKHQFSPITAVTSNSSNDDSSIDSMALKKENAERSLDDDFEPFYYQPTQYLPVPETNPVVLPLALAQFATVDDEQFLPLDDEFYATSVNNNNNSDYTNQLMQNYLHLQQQHMEQQKLLLLLHQLDPDHYHSQKSGIMGTFDKFKSQFPDFGV